MGLPSDEIADGPRPGAQRDVSRLQDRRHRRDHREVAADLLDHRRRDGAVGEELPEHHRGAAVDDLEHGAGAQLLRRAGYLIAVAEGFTDFDQRDDSSDGR
jgi:hypothetical protein